MKALFWCAANLFDFARLFTCVISNVTSASRLVSGPGGREQPDRRDDIRWETLGDGGCQRSREQVMTCASFRICCVFFTGERCVFRDALSSFKSFFMILIF